MEPSRRRVLAARILAVAADAVQLGLLPLFAGGAATGFDAVLDVAVGIVMVALVGWHWAFLPAFALELVPAVDLAPTWTIAVLIATRRMGEAEPPVPATRIDPPPLPPARG
ncbi:MAG TPA: hypothetical protein PLB01_08450 [Thermoanaerobaculia bacterium]|nr:hypothetical protein [Thermoanaerobaculia bacterium]